MSIVAVAVHHMLLVVGCWLRVVLCWLLFDGCLLPAVGRCLLSVVCFWCCCCMWSFAVCCSLFGGLVHCCRLLSLLLILHYVLFGV